MRSIGSGIRLFFFSDLVREVHPHTSVEAERGNEDGSLALSVTRVVSCVSRVFRSTD